MASARPSSTLLDAEGQHADRLLAVGLDLQEVDDLLDRAAVAGLLPPGPAKPQQRRGDPVADVDVAAEQQVVQDGEVLEQLDVLEGAGDARAGDAVGLLANQLAAEEADGAPLRPVQARQAVEQRGLAGAVGPDDGEQLAGPDLEGDGPQGPDAGEAEVDVGDPQDRLGGGAHDSHRLRRR
jgi:hypothetical protein